MSRQSKRVRRPAAALPPAMALSIAELKALIDTSGQRPLTEEETGKLHALATTLETMQAEYQSKTVSNKRLLEMLFGSPSERTRDVLKQGQPGSSPESEREAAAANDRQSDAAAPEKRKGHGRQGIAALTGAARIKVPHEVLAAGDPCPDPTCDGKVYPLKEPRHLVRITGVAPISACVYECARVRCNLCEEIHTAPAPEGVGEQKYDETVPAMLAMLRFGVGLPHPRIEKLQAGMGMPIASSTQWDLLDEAADEAEPAFEEIIRQGAQGQLFYQDDTWMQILKMTAEQRAEVLGEDDVEKRTGVFTTGIVSVNESVRIAIFMTGARHAGENLEQLLKSRAAGLPVPIQMCDASSNNTDGDFETLLANCCSQYPESGFIRMSSEICLGFQPNSMLMDRDKNSRLQGRQEGEQIGRGFPRRHPCRREARATPEHLECLALHLQIGRDVSARGCYTRMPQVIADHSDIGAGL
jgi:transposase